MLVFFVWLLSFSIGVISGKGWSDREHQVRNLESDNHFKAAQEDNEPLEDPMTKKEVELLTQRALEEAKAEAPDMSPAEDNPQRNVANEKMMDKKMMAASDKPSEKPSDKPKEKPDKDKEPKGREASTAKMDEPTNGKEIKREVSSLMPKPSVPKPTAVEYTVQVASYKTVEEAEKHSEKLIDKGFPAFPIRAMIDGKLWYRVSIGSFKSKKQAKKYEKSLRKQAVVKNTLVQKIKRLEK